jgi:hypothetical protein
MPVGGCDSRGSRSPPRPSPVAGSATPGLSMTTIVDAAPCSQHRDLGEGTNAELLFTDLFGTSVMHELVNDEFVPGPEAGDDVRCRINLPDGDGTWCGQPVPWVSLDWKDMVNAFGAERIRRVSLSTDEGSTAAGQTVGRRVSYVEIELAGEDRKGLASFIQAAFHTCADGNPTKVYGVPAVVGTVSSSHNANLAGEADAVAFLTPKRVAWAILDGRPWTAPERERALKAIASHLRTA